MMAELTSKLRLRHDISTPYYPQENGQVEAVNKVLVTMLQRTVGIHKSDWHLQLFSALWAYRTFAKSATGFTPFQLVYGLEETEKALNDCHSGACGGHMSGYATAQKILRAGYFWPSIFKDCITVVRKCHAC